MLQPAFFAQLAHDQASATETRDFGDEGTLLVLPDGRKMHLPAAMWRQYLEQRWRSSSDLF